MEERTFVGYGYGVFDTDDGRKQNYCNIFVLESFNGDESNDYHFGGVKSAKYKCTDPALFKNIEIGSQVTMYFDSKGKVCMMQAVPAKVSK